MKNIFNLDNRFFTFMGKVADVMILNLLFIITSIPTITIGTSLTALYSVSLKQSSGTSSYIAKEYFFAWKTNFKQSTIMWIFSLSRIVNYNEAYISRLFKQTNGLGISEYISQERINKAKTLLVSTSDSMQNIAMATGFDTAQYFSIVFKKSTGISPSEYRRSHT